jgi:hypothetical protein
LAAATFARGAAACRCAPVAAPAPTGAEYFDCVTCRAPGAASGGFHTSLYSARAAIDTHSKPIAIPTLNPNDTAASAQKLVARIIHADLH